MNKIKLLILKERIIKPFQSSYIFKFYTFLKKKIRERNKNKTILKKINGIYFELQLNQLIDNSLYYNSYFEKYTSQSINKMVDEGMTVFDIGANIGCHTLPLAQRVGEKGKVYAFEPMDWALKKLKKNIGLNRFSNIIVKDVGISDKQEVLKINFRSSWSLDNNENNNSQIIQEVKFTTIDEFIKNEGIIKVDFMKIDVDGYEPKILRGAVDCLTNHKPLIIIEFVDNKCTIVSFLSSLGYKFFSEIDFIPLLDPENYNRTNDLIVIHESRIHDCCYLKIK